MLNQLASKPLPPLPPLPTNTPLPLDLIFQALADPTRRGIVERLARGPASVSELAAPLAMSLPAVFQHLQVLEAAGLVSSDKAGRVRTCRVEPFALRIAEAWLAERRSLSLRTAVTRD